MKMGRYRILVKGSCSDGRVFGTLYEGRDAFDVILFRVWGGMYRIVRDNNILEDLKTSRMFFSITIMIESRNFIEVE